MHDSSLAIADRFPELAGVQDAALAEFLRSGRSVELPAGAGVFHAGDPCRAYLLVLAGRIVVRLTSEGGREVTLYEVQAGDACVLTTACLLGNQAYTADAMALTNVTACVFERAAFERALDASPALRRFVLGHLSQRLGGMIARFDEVTFGDVDRRLARTLLAAGAGQVRQTHEALAVAAGTAREVVSRHLKRFEAQGWVELGRGVVAIRDRQALEQLCARTPV
jgi:CRP/FNR family transcriptional regulator